MHSDTAINYRELFVLENNVDINEKELFWASPLKKMVGLL